MMHATRSDLTRVLDTVIRMQDAFWGSNQRIGEPFYESQKRIQNRRSYLKEPQLLHAFARFEALFRSLPRTLCHADFLPFNLIIGNERTVLIDWEHAGILPYPVMPARLLAHTSAHGETPFYMADADREFAIEYYYSHFIRHKGISHEAYLAAMDCFFFYEHLEWVYVYRKHKMPSDARYEHALKMSLAYADRILNEKRDCSLSPEHHF